MKEQPLNYVEVYNNLLLKNDDSVNGIKCLDCTWMKSWGFFHKKNSGGGAHETIRNEGIIEHILCGYIFLLLHKLYEYSGSLHAFFINLITFRFLHELAKFLL